MKDKPSQGTPGTSTRGDYRMELPPDQVLPPGRSVLVLPEPAIGRSQSGVVAGVLYADAVNQRIGALVAIGHLPQSAASYAIDLFNRLEPRDPLEEMLIIQAIVTHARAMHLNHTATRQERPITLQTVNEYADRASNTYRRLMLALAEYRRPPRPPANFTAIGQANLAQQQVVMNHEKAQTEKTANELGCPGQPAQPPRLPADSRGIEIAAGSCPAGEAVDTVHRA